MKIEITRGNRRYEVVPCGRRCSFEMTDQTPLAIVVAVVIGFAVAAIGTGGR